MTSAQRLPSMSANELIFEIDVTPPSSLPRTLGGCWQR